MCGSLEHDRRHCVAGNVGDVFQRQLPQTFQIQHVSLPPPPPDDEGDFLGSEEEGVVPTLAVPQQYVGRAVVKYFSDKVTKKRRPFSGIVRYMLLCFLFIINNLVLLVYLLHTIVLLYKTQGQCTTKFPTTTVIQKISPLLSWKKFLSSRLNKDQ